MNRFAQVHYSTKRLMLFTLILGSTLLGLASTVLAQEPVWDGNTVVLESKKLSDRVFAVIPTGAKEMAKEGKPVATTSGFIIGDDGVLVIDSMLNKRLANQLISLIKEQTDKPIKFLVNTSYR